VLGKGGVSRSEGGACSVMGVHASSARQSPPAKKNKSAVGRGCGGAVAAGADAGAGGAAGSSGGGGGCHALGGAVAAGADAGAGGASGSSGGGGGVARPGGGCHARGRGGGGPRMAEAAETEVGEGEFADSAEEEEKNFFSCSFFFLRLRWARDSAEEEKVFLFCSYSGGGGEGSSVEPV
jgi:hypothetical protein